MGLITLTDTQRYQLQQLLKYNRDGHITKRVLGILWLENNRPVEVAHRLGVTRQSVYNWLHHWRANPLHPGEVLADLPRSGRPPVKREMLEREINFDLAGLKKSPEECGYHASGWTTTLLVRHLERTQGDRVHVNTVSRILKGLGYRWKRPRYMLVRRDPHWRQVKGG